MTAGLEDLPSSLKGVFQVVDSSAGVLLPTPVRAISSDEPSKLLRFAVAAYREGPVALATLVDIRGGAARALGSHVVVAADGRFAGYVSGGCVEAAVAAEALLAMETGCDRMVSFGDGSPFLDIVLPCGGGITVAIHVLRSVDVIEHVLQSLEQRKVAGLKYTPERQTLTAIDPPDSAGVRNGDVHLVYRPVTRLILSGQTNETQSILRLAAASGYDCIVDDNSEPIGRLGLKIDPYTAVTLLHHDLDREEPVLDTALGSPAFYIGALGSTRTHGRRMKRLCASGWRGSDVERIKAPIGMFGPARDATTLALSVLADVAAARLITYP